MEWAEINAAWGQTALLLSSLAKVVGPHPFERYQIIPYGSYSYVKVLGDDKVLPLYGTGGFRMIWDTKFDQVWPLVENSFLLLGLISGFAIIPIFSKKKITIGVCTKRSSNRRVTSHAVAWSYDGPRP